MFDFRQIEVLKVETKQNTKIPLVVNFTVDLTQFLVISDRL